MTQDGEFLKVSTAARNEADLDQLVASREAQKGRLTILAASGIFTGADLERFQGSITDLDVRINKRVAGIRTAVRESIQKHASHLSE
jgi:hypothetical protein